MFLQTFAAASCHLLSFWVSLYPNLISPSVLARSQMFHRLRNIGKQWYIERLMWKKNKNTPWGGGIVSCLDKMVATQIVSVYLKEQFYRCSRIVLCLSMVLAYYFVTISMLVFLYHNYMLQVLDFLTKLSIIPQIYKTVWNIFSYVLNLAALQCLVFIFFFFTQFKSDCFTLV